MLRALPIVVVVDSTDVEAISISDVNVVSDSVSKDVAVAVVTFSGSVATVVVFRDGKSVSSRPTTEQFGSFRGRRR